MGNVAFLFPGQGAQSVGMGKDFAEHSAQGRKVYDIFDGVVPNLSQVCFEGPEEELRRTLYTQPAILATSLAAFELFRERSNVKPVVAAGHSLGEYGALYAAGVIDLKTAAKLIQKRAELMDNAPQGAMSVVLGAPEDLVSKILARLKNEGFGPVVVANYNSGDQLVLSGDPKAVEEAGTRLKDEGARRVMPLPVSGAFHSPLMDEAACEFAGFLKEFSFSEAAFPVITNVDATETRDGEKFREKLADQINHSVYWTHTMNHMFTELHVDTVVEFGPGKVLTGIIRKIYKDVAVHNVNSMETLERTVEALGAKANV